MRSPGQPPPLPRVAHLASRARLAPALALAAATALAACGGGGGGTDPVTPPVDCTPTKVVAAAGAYQRFSASDWDATCGALTVRAPALASGERLAVALVNAGGPDSATPSITVSGVSAFADAPGAAPLASMAAAPYPGPAPLLEPDRTPIEIGHARMAERRARFMERWLAEGAPRPASPAAARTQRLFAASPAVGDTAPNGGFCVYNMGTDKYSRQPATIRWVSANAVYYVTDAVWTKVQGVLSSRPDLWTTLESYFEGTVSARNPAPVQYRVHPSLATNFGPETDVDGNGRVIFLFADLGKDSASGGFPVGYFDGTDVVVPLDTTPSCTGSASNHADMLYMLDPGTFQANGWSLSLIIDQEMPGTMAHELQHNVLFNNRCLAPVGGPLASCSAIDKYAQDLWLNEGLSMVSEDLAGFGLHGSSERQRVGIYVTCAKTSASALCHQEVSLTTWPSTGGNPYGHYGGSHAFLRWHLDQADSGRAAVASGPAFTRAIVGSSQLSRAAIAAASGQSFEEGFVRFALGTLFSGEDTLFSSYSPAALRPAPDFAYASSVPWSPLHSTVGRMGYTTLPKPGQASFTTTLRNDGFGTFVTGVGTGADATLTVTSTASVKPTVGVVRFKGSLPRP